MAAIAFDTLNFARRLKAAGVPEQQAEAQAELMAEAFVFNMDSLVTKDYLEATLNARFQEFENRMDKRFSQLETRIEVMSTDFEGRFRHIYWMLGIIIASTTLPQLIKLLSP